MLQDHFSRSTLQARMKCLSANAGQADAAGDNGQNAIAGHAIMLAIPKPQALKSMINCIFLSTGMYEELSEQQRHAAKSCQTMLANRIRVYAKALYHAEDLKRMPEEDVAILSTADGLLSLAQKWTSLPLLPRARLRLSHVLEASLQCGSRSVSGFFLFNRARPQFYNEGRQ